MSDGTDLIAGSLSTSVRVATRPAGSGDVTAEHGGRSVLLAGPISPLLVALEAAFAMAGARVAVSEKLPLRAHERGDAEAIIGAAALELDGLDVLVRHEPIAASGALLEASADEWRSAVGAGLVGAFELSRAAAQAMTDGGAIVNVASVDAVHAYRGRSAAAAVMAGLVGLTRALAIELAERKVRANLVIVGPLAELVPSGVEPEHAERTLLRAPSHRLGTAVEAARSVVFVAGPRAGFMTGQSLRVDGGWASLNQAPDGLKFK